MTPPELDTALDYAREYLKVPRGGGMKVYKNHDSDTLGIHICEFLNPLAMILAGTLIGTGLGNLPLHWSCGTHGYHAPGWLVIYGITLGIAGLLPEILDKAREILRDI